MFYFKRSLLLVGLLLMMFVAACGAATTSSTNNTTSGTANNGMNKNDGATMTTNPSPTAKSTTDGGMTPKYPTATPANNMQGGNMMGKAFINTTKVKINGKMITVLTDEKGMMLYYTLKDPRPKSACVGTCAQAWPPVLAQDMGMISSSMTLPHKLSVYMTANGNQVEYDGHPLYRYAGDMTPGQFSGRGMGMVWYLVATTL